MPLRNGTGPAGQGPRTGRGLGQGRGQFRGRQPKGFGMGPDGNCVCTNPECNHKVAHQRANPCYELKCPKCGSPMTRQR